MELPLGFGMALAQNPGAMEAYAALPEERKRELLAQAHAARSRREMQALVNRLEKI